MVQDKRTLGHELRRHFRGSDHLATSVKLDPVQLTVSNKCQIKVVNLFNKPDTYV